MKRLGPELKMPALKKPDLKVPTLATDLFYDLRERRLLPLVAIVLAAIVAVPIALSESADESAAPPIDAGANASGSADGAEPLVVVESKPGLRDYRKRLRGRTPTDPFQPRYAGPASGSQLPPQTVTETTTTTPTTTGDLPSSDNPSAGAPESGGDGGGDGRGGDEPEGRIFTFAIDVQISRSEARENGRQVMGEPKLRQGVLPTTPLPGPKAPVVTYMGVNLKNGRKALLMISNNVESVFGDGKCLSGTDTCQLIEVEPGFPLTFVYGGNDVRYKFNVIRIERVFTGHT